MVKSKIVSIKKLVGYVGNRYDIETERTHNFFANDILVHNSSVTYYWRDGVFGVCSKNIDLLETPGNTYWNVARKYDVEKKLREYGRSIAIQGEIFGHSIQRNYGLPNQAFAVYSVYDLAKNAYMDYENARETVKSLDLPFVPFVDEFTLGDTVTTVDDLLKMSNRKSTINPTFQAEGIVCRTYEEATDPELGRLSFKVLSNKDLLDQKI